MDAIKKPETVIAGGALLTSVGTAVYFHRQIGAINEDVLKISEHLAATVRKLSDNEIHSTHIAQLAQAVKELNSLGMRQGQLLDGIQQSMDYRDRVIDEQGNAITEIQRLLSEEGHRVQSELTPSLRQGTPAWQAPRVSDVAPDRAMSYQHGMRDPRNGSMSRDTAYDHDRDHDHRRSNDQQYDPHPRYDYQPSQTHREIGSRDEFDRSTIPPSQQNNFGLHGQIGHSHRIPPGHQGSHVEHSLHLDQHSQNPRGVPELNNTRQHSPSVGFPGGVNPSSGTTDASHSRNATQVPVSGKHDAIQDSRPSSLVDGADADIDPDDIDAQIRAVRSRRRS